MADPFSVEELRYLVRSQTAFVVPTKKHPWATVYPRHPVAADGARRWLIDLEPGRAVFHSAEAAFAALGLAALGGVLERAFSGEAPKLFEYDLLLVLAQAGNDFGFVIPPPPDLVAIHQRVEAVPLRTFPKAMDPDPDHEAHLERCAMFDQVAFLAVVERSRVAATSGAPQVAEEVSAARYDAVTGVRIYDCAGCRDVGSVVCTTCCGDREVWSGSSYVPCAELGCEDGRKRCPEGCAAAAGVRVPPVRQGDSASIGEGVVDG